MLDVSACLYGPGGFGGVIFTFNGEKRGFDSTSFSVPVDPVKCSRALAVSFMCDSVCVRACECVWVDVVEADQPVVFSSRLLLAVVPKAKVSLSPSLPLRFHLSISNYLLLLSEPLTVFNICQKGLDSK